MDIQLLDQTELERPPTDQQLFQALKPRLQNIFGHSVLEVRVERFLMKMLWNTRPSRKKELLQRLTEGIPPQDIEDPLDWPDAEKMVKERQTLLDSDLPYLKECWEVLAPTLHQLLEPIPAERTNYHLLGCLVSEMGWRKRYQFLNNHFYSYMLEHYQLEEDFAETIVRRWWSNRERALERILEEPPNWLFQYSANILVPATEHEDPEIRKKAIRLAGNMEGGLTVPSQDTSTTRTQ